MAAIGENGEMGHNNQLLWHLPGDLPRFKAMTLGWPIIMGRKTFDSIGKALPGRTNIVLTGNRDWQHEDVSTAHTVEKAIIIAEESSDEKVFVIGGGEIYRLFLAYATTLELTEVFDAPVADTYFPNFSSLDFKEVSREQIRGVSPEFDYVRYRKT